MMVSHKASADASRMRRFCKRPMFHQVANTASNRLAERDIATDAMSVLGLPVETLVCVNGRLNQRRRMDPVAPRNADRVDGPIRAMSRTPSQEFLGPSGGLRPGGRPTAQQQQQQGPTASSDVRGSSSQR